MKKIIKKKPKPTCQTPGCYNTCARRKDNYCAGCIKYPLRVQNTYIPPVTVNQTPPSPPVTVNQTPLPPPVTVNQTPLSPPVTINQTPQPPPETVTQAVVTVNQPIETVKPTTIPSPELTKVPSNSVINKTEMTLLTNNLSEYKDVQTFFRTGLPNNTILGIFKLDMPTHLVKAHDDYRTKNLNMMNIRVFHGTKHICNPKRFISNPKAEFCNSGCGVCGIAQNGNKIAFSRDRRLWFANNSSVSLGYCNNGYQMSYGNGKNGAKYGTVENAMFIVELITHLPGPVFTLDSEAATLPKYLIIFQ
ncbi:hypothetical protein C2G38_2090946 [Gigaspora rosea]|uniref:PARP catalytic domain-containing protein n=1 Tax=Gigaspora rosea TaxID=44941 RepID=A0A397V475_9GLOM|nr:hypothetical protein C2G38_2090946 [Gigaspora rosea]CAG8636505.1 25237_t:CDS:2 [Gigaspora rosea]